MLRTALRSSKSLRNLLTSYQWLCLTNSGRAWASPEYKSIHMANSYVRMYQHITQHIHSLSKIPMIHISLYIVCIMGIFVVCSYFRLATPAVYTEKGRGWYSFELQLVRFYLLFMTTSYIDHGLKFTEMQLPPMPPWYPGWKVSFQGSFTMIQFSMYSWDHAWCPEKSGGVLIEGFHCNGFIMWRLCWSGDFNMSCMCYSIRGVLTGELQPFVVKGRDGRLPG